MKIRRLDANGDACFGHGASDWVTDAAAVAQLCYSRMKLNLGEWFLDLLLGVSRQGQPEGQQTLLGRRFDETFAQAELKRVALETPGVSAISAFSFVYDSTTREAEARIDILTIYGAPPTIVVRSDT